MPTLLLTSTGPEEIKRRLTHSLDSGHVHLLIGSGASTPAIPIAGSIEERIAELAEQDDAAGAARELYGLLSRIQEVTDGLSSGMMDAATQSTLGNYQSLLLLLERVLARRRTAILPRQVTIFTTNYDLFVEKAASVCESAVLNAGFTQGGFFESKAEYSTRSFHRTVYDSANPFEYRVELPSINLVKLHGCLGWRRDGERICWGIPKQELLPDTNHDAKIQEFLSAYTIVLPRQTKFSETVLDRTYYELLRLFSNSLDKENAFLLSFGFSFRDEHILHIARRALANPTLNLMAVAYDQGDKTHLTQAFSGHENVTIVSPPEGEVIGFSEFNALLQAATPETVQ